MQKGVSKTKALIDSGAGKDFTVNIEKKHQKPAVDKLQKLAAYFNVSTDYLLGNEQQEKSLPPLSDKDKEAIELFEKLSAHDKDFFIQLLKDRLK
jgi:transcriptional regulator with XRE-family HTH domain